ncbi:hypothetical protein GCM10028820_33700 [Tessaracoccus terricola]
MPTLTDVISEALRGFGLTIEAPSTSDGRADLVATFPGPDPVRAGVDVRQRSQPLGPVEAANWARTRQDGTILALPAIPAGRGAQYRALGINYVDSGGNAHLSVPGFHVHVEGRKPRAISDAAPRAQSASANPAGLKVTFALLVDPEVVGTSYEQLTALSGVSKGTVSNTIADLRERGHIFTEGPRRKLIDPDRLARDWVDAYVRVLAPRLRRLELAGPEPQWWEQNWRDTAGTLGGGVALAELGAALKPDHTVVYGRPPWQAIRREARLSRDGNAPVILREQFWSDALLRGARYVPPLLAYADALADTDPRETEAAQELAVRNQWRFAR